MLEFRLMNVIIKFFLHDVLPISSGEIILSIEGPSDKVSALVRSQATPELHASEVTRTTPDYITVPGSPVRRVNRVLAVTGRLSVDSLNALARLATIR